MFRDTGLEQKNPVIKEYDQAFKRLKDALDHTAEEGNISVAKHIKDPDLGWVLDNSAHNGEITELTFLPQTLHTSGFHCLKYTVVTPDKGTQERILQIPHLFDISYAGGAKPDGTSQGQGEIRFTQSIKEPNTARVFSGWFPPATDTSPSPSL